MRTVVSQLFDVKADKSCLHLTIDLLGEPILKGAAPLMNDAVILYIISNFDVQVLIRNAYI